MANVSSLHISFLLPTTSLARISDAMAEIRKAIEDQKGRDIALTLQTPYEISAATATETTNGRERLERDAGRDEDAREGKQGARGNAGSDADDGDGKPKRGRGRPRKSDAERDGDGAEASRSSGEERGRKRDADRAEADEDARGNEPVRTRKGADEGADEGEGRERGAGRSRDDQRGNREAARISSGKDRGEADEGWGDEEKGSDWEDADEDPRLVAARSSGKFNWPNDLLPCDPDAIDKTVIQTLLGEHLASTGGKDKGPTFDIIDDVAGTRALGEVDERDYVKLAKALMKATARNEFNLG